MTKNYVLKFEMVKILKAPAGFELMPHGLVVNALTHCARKKIWFRKY